MAWIDQMKSTEPHRAVWWANHLVTIGLSPQIKPRAQAVITEQASKPDTANYANAIAEIEKFTATILASGPQYSPTCFNHTTPEIQKKVDKMLESYGTTPWIKQILTALKEKTGQG